MIILKQVKIEKLDYFGRGITHVDGKVVFVNNALPGEVLDIAIKDAKKNYSEAQVIRYIKKSTNRTKSLCPYFPECGGCNLLFYDYPKSLEFKLQKVKDIFTQNNITYEKDIEITPNKNQYNYRNKVSLKIVNGKVGYFKDSTHDLIKITKCLIAKEPINKVIENFQLLNINNGTLTIRCNYNNEILLIINNSDNNYNIELTKLKELIKLVGIVYNDKTIYGENFFYERIGGFLFKVSYNSFFQVNHYIASELFKLVEANISDGEVVLDLYSGVGTLGIVASSKAHEVLSIEVVKNAVLNGIFNAKINKRDNIKFILGDAGKQVNKLNKKIDTLIVDPPRKGLDTNSINFILKNKPKKIIYISCDVATLTRDLKKLANDYELTNYKILDMFSFSYHLESFCVLIKR